jgi:FtsP/CotA-like multicopper oxidase with cupredoxin domain
VREATGSVGRRFFLGSLAALGGLAKAGVSLAQGASGGGKVRTYYVAADEIEWDYCPTGINQYTGKPFEGLAKTMVENGPHRIGKVYRKVAYREYTDETFTHLKPRPAEDAYMGILGPSLYAEVGDTIRVVFKNNASRPYSMHPHGVFYDKDSEGAPYNDGVPMAEKPGAAVPPGKTHVYTWPVPERAGPGPNDPSSLGWQYHSHVKEMRDTNSGLVGFITVTRRGMARPDGRPKDVDREFFSMYLMFDENQSWYLDHNIKAYCDDPLGVNKTEFVSRDTDGRYSIIGVGFAAANMKSAINGYMFANMPVMKMKRGDRVRWYVGTLGFGFNFHTPHWHGNTVMLNGSRVDVISLAPAQALTVDMVPDNPGIWLYHCHVSDHFDMGMMSFYQVQA